MIRISILLTLALFSSSPLYSLDIKGMMKKKDKAPDIDVVTWTASVADSLPAEVDGIRVFRPGSNDNDGNPVVKGDVNTGNVNAADAFTAAYICVKDMFDPESKDAVEAVDYDNHAFTVFREIHEGEYQNSVTYRFMTNYAFADGKMSFSVYDINIEYKEKGILPRKVNLAKLKPATNDRHGELLEGFNITNSRVIDRIAKAVGESPAHNVTHWSDIKAGKVVKGMNEAEVRLIGGTPRSVTPWGDGQQWIYSNDFIVIFLNGIVTNVIQ